MDYTTAIRSKIHTREELVKTVERWRFFGSRLIFTNGCFDILHAGHLHLLVEAKALRGKLIVALNTDRSVKKLKGPDRPIHNEAERSMLLAALSMVDAVIRFEEDTPLELIRLVQPDYLVKGGDYKAGEVVGADIVQSKGGKVVIIDLLEGHSTTRITEKLRTSG